MPLLFSALMLAFLYLRYMWKHGIVMFKQYRIHFEHIAYVKELLRDKSHDEEPQCLIEWVLLTVIVCFSNDSITAIFHRSLSLAVKFKQKLVKFFYPTDPNLPLPKRLKCIVAMNFAATWVLFCLYVCFRPLY